MEHLASLLTPENLVALLTLTSLEIVLGIDNIVFIAILTGTLEPARQPRARLTGLAAAMLMRIVLLLAITWIMGLTETLVSFNLLGHPIALSGKSLILIGGGLFLLGKATFEIHDKLEAAPHESKSSRRAASFASVIVQIMLLDLVFSIDSVITAVGMAQHIEIMVAAVILSVVVMMVFAGPVCRFIEHHPTLKMLALSFLLLIGVTLVAEGLGTHVSKGYIYFAMGFSLFVELLNIRFRKLHVPVPLHQPRLPD